MRTIRVLALVMAVGAGVSCAKSAPKGPAELPEFSADPRNRKAADNHAIGLYRQAYELSEQKRWSDAARFALEALEYRARAHGHHSKVIAPALVWVADALIRNGDYAIAYQLALRARDIAAGHEWTALVTAANRRLGLLTKLRSGARFPGLAEELVLEPPPIRAVEPPPPVAAPPGAPPERGFGDAPVVTKGHIEGAAAVVAALRMRFGECLARGLQTDRSLNGRIELELLVGADGRVGGMRHTHTGSLTPWVIDCVRWVASQAQFQAPPGGTAQLMVPVNFTRE